MNKLLAVQEALGDRLGLDLVILAVSLDFARDDGAALREHAVRLGARRAGWKFLRGPRERIESLLRRYGVAFGLPREILPTTQIGHAALIVTVDRRGRRAQDFHGTEYPDETLVARVRALLDE
jgi:cytochrome oxidase Cu insertion factor (SCO1/SenC/PrrC family)